MQKTSSLSQGSGKPGYTKFLDSIQNPFQLKLFRKHSRFKICKKNFYFLVSGQQMLANNTFKMPYLNAKCFFGAHIKHSYKQPVYFSFYYFQNVLSSVSLCIKFDKYRLNCKASMEQVFFVDKVDKKYNLPINIDLT